MEGCSSTTVLIPLLFCILFFISINSLVAAAGDIIKANHIVRDGSTIVSSGGHFEFGFVSVGSSTNRYLGIWYKKIPGETIVWIANREAPLTTTSGLLQLSSNGNLVILNASDHVVWSSNSSTSVNNPVLQLLDSGNLVIRDGTDSNPDHYLWQSFDIPGNTQLPGAKLGWNLETGLERYLSSWKSEDDPSAGKYTNRIYRNGFPQLVVSKGSAIFIRGGSWNGVRFSGTPNLNPNKIYTYQFVSNDKELYYRYFVNSSVYTRRILNSFGNMQRSVWIEKSQIWQIYLSAPMDDCDRYGICGAYGSCNINNSPACKCFNGFQPKNKIEWDASDWSSGCARKVQLSCVNGEGFVKHSGLKLPDTQRSWFDTNMSLDECERVCLKNCSCTAFANTDIRGRGSGCLLWFNELIDIRDEMENGQDLYIRMAASELAKKGRSKVKFICIPILSTITVMCVCLWVIKKKKKKKCAEEGKTTLYFETNGGNGKGDEDLELPLFDFTTLATATNGFSKNSMLGEGGFGPVYKGMLNEGKEIAVKRLSKDSRQGLKEFKNEVSCIARLQHRNLVKLLGCSVQEGERMLVYEYMPNKSLDSFIFDKKQSNMLDWPMRYNIINGIARGLLYLHQDSRLRIIHRDLKASNVLLDLEMNPKISDFGTARICGETETGAHTTRVVGTYGYMSPEYATDGIFSVKSDVYSFGVMLLEIVSGKRNKSFTHPDHNLNLLGHAWINYRDGNVLDLVDEAIAESCQEHQLEVFRAIHIGLLCVQQYPADRPTMATVVLMLTSEIPLPEPKEPGFFTQRKLQEEDSSSSSSNYLSVTAMVPR
ncbi:Receptor-like serine/threonine-protein kinase [Heracleum sosnowskyi]|uniref:Receptor-like serine/threonine-protein kinase n=1 Tax=Heracleum sosnowskyi TaxID=360622 RepID=A0AAD8N1V8_9APIA|nr:Receptor-like serine/threonine-protein kinase [Heracleum sosnowskyi]